MATFLCGVVLSLCGEVFLFVTRSAGYRLTNLLRRAGGNNIELSSKLGINEEKRT